MSQNRRIAAFDVETTGKDPASDQIIELSIRVVDAEDLNLALSQDAVESFVQRFRPSVPVSPGAQAVHGISDADLENEPTFRECADRVAELLLGADVLIGYNVTFDIRFVEAEFGRIGRTVNLFSKPIVDPLRIWHHHEPRRLENAFERFVGGSMEHAHSAEADTQAVLQVLSGMRSSFGIEHVSWDDLADMTVPDRRLWIGPTHHIRWEAGEIVFGFGKHQGRPVHEVAKVDENYLQWIQDKDFPRHVQNLCKGAASGITREEFRDRVADFFGEPESIAVE